MEKTEEEKGGKKSEEQCEQLKITVVFWGDNATSKKEYFKNLVIWKYEKA